MSSTYRGKVPRAVGNGTDTQKVGGDKDRRVMPVDPDASMYNRYGQGSPQAPALSDRDLKRVEQIHVMPNERAVYIKVKARYE